MITKYLSLNITIDHNGQDDHSKIIASEQTAREFEQLIDSTMDYLYHRIQSWEKEYKNKIEQVGR
jgi:hypothetical protein